MGVTKQFYAFHSEVTQWIRRDPGVLDEILDSGGDLRAVYEECRSEGLADGDMVEWISFGLLSQMIGNGVDKRLAEFGVDELDLDKAWGCLAFALRRINPDFARDLFDGGEVLEGRVIRILDASLVLRIGGWLKQVEPAVVQANLVVDEMKRQDVYPEIWRAGEDAMRTEVKEAYVALQDFFEEASQRGLSATARTTL
jgi:hypothetical protein